MRILVFEDEPGIAHFIRQGSSETGYAVDVSLDGQAGLEYAGSVIQHPPEHGRPSSSCPSSSSLASSAR